MKPKDVDRLIHEPARLVIMTILSVVEQVDFLYLLNETGLTRGNLSTHLSRLEEGGYIQIDKTYRGKTPATLIRITPEGSAAYQAYKNHLHGIMQRTAKEGRL